MQGKKSKKDSTGKKVFMAIIIFMIVILAIIAAYLILCQTVQNNTIWESVSINNVPLEGLTYEEAQQAIQEKFETDYADKVITVAIDDNEYMINALQFLNLDASEQLDSAYMLGHGSWIESGYEWIRMRLSQDENKNIEVLPAVVEGADVASAIENTGILEYRSLRATTWDIEDTDVVFHKGHTGKIPDEEQLVTQVQNALNSLNFTDLIECPYTADSISEPDYQNIAESVYVEAADATLDADNDYAIVESVTGRYLDVDAAKEAYDAAEEDTDVVVSFTYVEPDVTTQWMEENLFSTVLGSYETTVSGSSEKINNVGLAVESCNGVIILPGESFSYNDVVGETTAARGFQTAAVYKNGSVEYEVGGGVCQVSSTIFAATLYTKLEITERSAHSMVVTYIPYGMDATVYWTKPNFAFTNNYNYPIKLALSFVDNVISVQIIGTKEDNITIECRVEQLDTLKFETYRDYYDEDGNLLDSEYVCYSSYKPVSS